MNSTSLYQLFSDFLEGNLSAEEGRTFEQRLETDPSFRAEFEEFQNIISLEKKLRETSWQAPTSFQRKVMEEISELSENTLLRRFSRSLLGWFNHFGSFSYREVGFVTAIVLLSFSVFLAQRASEVTSPPIVEPPEARRLPAGQSDSAPVNSEEIRRQPSDSKEPPSQALAAEVEQAKKESAQFENSPIQDAAVDNKVLSLEELSSMQEGDKVIQAAPHEEQPSQNPTNQDSEDTSVAGKPSPQKKSRARSLEKQAPAEEFMLGGIANAPAAITSGGSSIELQRRKSRAESCDPGSEYYVIPKGIALFLHPIEGSEPTYTTTSVVSVLICKKTAAWIALRGLENGECPWRKSEIDGVICPIVWRKLN